MSSAAKRPAEKSETKKSSAERVRRYRERQRAKGLRLVQFWVPDMNTPEFIAEARRQSSLVAESPHEKDDQAFIDSISEWPDH